MTLFSHFSPAYLNNRSTKTSLRSRELRRKGMHCQTSTFFEESKQLLTPLIILKVVSGVAVGLCCPQGPQPGEISDHGIRSTIHNAWERNRVRSQRGKPHPCTTSTLQIIDYWHSQSISSLYPPLSWASPLSSQGIFTSLGMMQSCSSQQEAEQEPSAPHKLSPSRV